MLMLRLFFLLVVINRLGIFSLPILPLQVVVSWEAKATHDFCAHTLFMRPAPCVRLISTLLFVLIVLLSETT